MDRYENHPPDDLREIAARLVQARTTFTPLALDELRRRIHRRAERASQSTGAVRKLRRTLPGLAAIGLMLTSGAGAVIASTSIAGSAGHGVSLAAKFGSTFGDTNLHDMRDASYCQFHGPFSQTAVVPTKHGDLTITLVWNCKNLNVHIHFGGGFMWTFGDGRDYSARGSSDTDVLDGTPELAVSAGGATYSTLFNW